MPRTKLSPSIGDEGSSRRHCQKAWGHTPSEPISQLSSTEDMFIWRRCEEMAPCPNRLNAGLSTLYNWALTLDETGD